MAAGIENILAVNVTCISNEFLDKYMAEANGDYIKVYLYILRHMGEDFSVRGAADAVNLTESDIKRAVKYWESKGIIKNPGEEKDSVTEKAPVAGKTDPSEKVCNGAVKESSLEKESQLEKESSLEKESPAGKEYLNHVKENFIRDTAEGINNSPFMNVTEDGKTFGTEEEFDDILFVCRQVIQLPGRNLLETLRSLYFDIHIPKDVLEYLLEYAADMQKTTPRYIETVALNWKHENILTAEDAQKKVREIEDSKKKKQSGSRKQTRTEKLNILTNMETETVDYDLIALRKAENRWNGTK